MNIANRLCATFCGLAALAASVVGNAQVVGTTTDGNSDPFGFYNWTGTYQQVYSSNAFAGTTDITSLTFFDFNNSPADALTPTSFSIYLSTTAATVGGLSPTLADNIGPNQTLVFSGNPPGESIIGGAEVFTFSLSTNFIYDPSAGNLLLTVINQNPGPFNPITTYLDSDSSGSLMSRAFAPPPFPGTLATTDSVGLVTGFNIAHKVPEPSTLSLVFACYIGLASVWITNKRRQQVQARTGDSQRTS